MRKDKNHISVKGDITTVKLFTCLNGASVSDLNTDWNDVKVCAWQFSKTKERDIIYTQN